MSCPRSTTLNNHHVPLSLLIQQLSKLSLSLPSYWHCRVSGRCHFSSILFHQLPNAIPASSLVSSNSSSKPKPAQPFQDANLLESLSCLNASQCFPITVASKLLGLTPPCHTVSFLPRTQVSEPLHIAPSAFPLYMLTTSTSLKLSLRVFGKPSQPPPWFMWNMCIPGPDKPGKPWLAWPHRCGVKNVPYLPCPTILKN